MGVGSHCTYNLAKNLEWELEVELAHNPYYTNVYLCAKCGDLKPTINENQILKFGPVSEQGAETRFQKKTVELLFSFNQIFQKC